jgi:hypothetical protein
MKNICLVLILTLSSFTAMASPAESEVALEKIRVVLLKHKEVHGQFKQVRNLKDLKLNLESEGQFRFKLPLDLTWNQTKPFVMDLIMTPDKIVQKNGDGSEHVMTKAQQPVVFVFSTSFMGIFAGDTKVIQKNFNYEGTFKTSGWAMTLEPKDELLRKVIANVKIEGGEFVEKVNVNEKSGNSTAIVFSKVKGD